MFVPGAISLIDPDADRMRGFWMQAFCYSSCLYSSNPAYNSQNMSIDEDGGMCMTTAFLEPRGTYSEQAAVEFAGGDDDLLEVPNFAAAVAAVENGQADYAVVPVENSIEGPVSQSLDILIHDTDLKLFAEIEVAIQHVLVGPAKVDTSRITHVHSHPQALAQCGKWLDAHLSHADRVAEMSTSGAVRQVVENGDPAHVAIGPERSHTLYGGELLARNIQDVPNNRTRFMALAKHDAEPTGNDKTFLAMRLDKNLPGSLYTSLGPFARENVQLTNIITRPTKGLLGEYYFLIDLEGHRKDPHIAAGLQELREITEDLKVIGSCPRYNGKKT